VTFLAGQAVPLPRSLAGSLRTLFDREHFRYVCSGGLCALLNNVVFIGGASLGYSFLALTLVSALVAGTIGYGLHLRYSFREQGRWRGYVQFLGGTALGIPLTVALLALQVQLLGWPMWIASPITTVVMVLYNYASARLAIVGRLIGRRMLHRR